MKLSLNLCQNESGCIGCVSWKSGFAYAVFLSRTLKYMTYEHQIFKRVTHISSNYYYSACIGRMPIFREG